MRTPDAFATFKLLTLTTVAVLALTTVTGCQSSHRANGSAESTRFVSTPTAAESAAFDRLKSLAGNWESQGEDGSWHPGSTFTVTSAGSVVREVMMPGKPHEMTNMYHMDGGDIVATHYCAAGNQPRMRAHGMNGNTLAFHFDSVTNLKKSDHGVMREMAITFIDNDHFEVAWTNYDVDGKKSDHSPVFKYRRVS
jgi:hypothetical protein